MAEIGFGVIGLGRMGSLHALHLRGSIQGARLVAAVVDNADHAALEASGAAPCALVRNVEALITQPGVDAVVVASPTSFHLEHISLVARAGKPIFAEKPIAGSVADAREAVAILHQHAVPFQIGFHRRFDPGYAHAHQLITDGVIGTPEMFRGISCDRIPPVDYLRSSGGLFWDLGIHEFDAARFLMGDEIAEVHATGATIVEPRLREFDDVDHGVVTLRFRRGGIGVVQTAWRAPYGYDIRAEVHGSDGKVITEVDTQFPVRSYTSSGLQSTRHVRFVDRFAEAYRRELESFVLSLIRDSAPTPGAEDALAACLVADAATESRRSGQSVTVAPR